MAFAIPHAANAVRREQIRVFDIKSRREASCFVDALAGDMLGDEREYENGGVHVAARAAVNKKNFLHGLVPLQSFYHSRFGVGVAYAFFPAS